MKKNNGISKRSSWSLFSHVSLNFVAKYMDHVHLLISAKPMLDIPKHINTIKGHSSLFPRKEYETFLQDKSQGAHFWSSSYFISSTGHVSIDVLKQYVENQRRKIALES
ncbi:MAG: IS200/IS605 family transposase [Promethearchaeota archaeon]